MSILIDDGSRVLVQGITGREGEFHTERMIRYGTRPVKRRRRASGSWWSSPSMSRFWIWCG